MKTVLAVVVAFVIGVAVAQSASDTPVILINPFEVPDGKLDESIAMWELARDYLQQQPGYISTALHQSLTDDSRFRLVNVASWQSARDFLAASKKMRSEAGLPGVEGLIASPALYTIIKHD